MGKLIAFVFVFLLLSCTTRSQKIQILQKKYVTVHYVVGNRYVCIDSVGKIYDVLLDDKGDYDSIVKIN